MVEDLTLRWLLTGVWGFVCLALVVLLLVPRPRRAVNLALAAFLLLEITQGVVTGLPSVLGDRALAYNAELWGDALLILLDVTYLTFLRAALDIPILKPLRSRAGGFMLAAIATLAVLPFLFPSQFSVGIVADGPGWDAVPGPWSYAFTTVDLIVTAASLVFSMLAIRHAPAGTTARSRAKVYAVAFGLQDVGVLMGYSSLFLGVSWFTTVGLGVYGFFFGLILSSCVLAYALLRWQLFDFELKVKLTIRRGTVAGIFIAVFFVVAEVASNFLASTVGYAIGGVAAGLLLFAIRPLERIADRVADKAMPTVRDSPVYAQFKKLEVYRAAVETALEDDGEIDAKERRMLEGLRTKLQIHDDDARALEAEVAERYAGAVASAA